MKQNALTVITEIKTGAGELEALERLLDEIGGDIQRNPYIRFTTMTTLHFACWVVLPAQQNLPPKLALETNFDGPVIDHVREFVQHGLDALRRIYAHCVGFPVTSDPLEMEAFLLSYRVATSAFFIGCPGQSLARIRDAVDTRNAIENYLDQLDASGELATLNERELMDKIRRFVHTNRPPQPDSEVSTFFVRRVSSILYALLGIALAIPLAILLSPFIAAFVIVLRKHEKRDPRIVRDPNTPVDPRLFDKEDVLIQNHLTNLAFIKPGRFRQWTIRALLSLVELLARTVFVNGHLGEMSTIHFARWVVLDDGRVLFLSNYDGSWASYIGDFVDKASYGLTAIWSNTEGFPNARFLAFEGATNIELYKQWSRSHNLYAAVWYSAYPNETVGNILKSLKIREDIQADPLCPRTLAFLRRL